MLALLWAADVLAGSAAVIRGPERAFLRRGPGTEFQAYATVENGEQVTVEEVTGTWALVRLANGQSGYVHAAFLFYADNKPVLVSTPTAGPSQAVATPASAPAPAAAAAPVAPAPAPAAKGAAAAAEANELAQRNAELNAEVETLRHEVEALRRNPSAPPSPGEDLVSLRAEVRRLADVTDALRSRLDAPSSGVFPNPIAADDPWSSSAFAIVLAAVALLLGLLLGSFFAHREERGRRNRIRF